MGGSEAAAAEGAVEPRREGERGGERKQGEGGRERGARMGGCLGRVNCFSAGRNPDNGRREKSSSREALRQRWRPGQAPTRTTEIRRMTSVSQGRKHPVVGLGAPVLLSVLEPGPGRGQGLREGLAGGNPWGPSSPSGCTGGSLKSNGVLGSSVPETGAKERGDAGGRRGSRTGERGRPLHPRLRSLSAGPPSGPVSSALQPCLPTP